MRGRADMQPQRQTTAAPHAPIDLDQGRVATPFPAEARILLPAGARKME
jgi:hypothetical protein